MAREYASGSNAAPGSSSTSAPATNPSGASGVVRASTSARSAGLRYGPNPVSMFTAGTMPTSTVRLRCASKPVQSIVAVGGERQQHRGHGHDRSTRSDPCREVDRVGFGHGGPSSRPASHPRSVAASRATAAGSSSVTNSSSAARWGNRHRSPSDGATAARRAGHTSAPVGERHGACRPGPTGTRAGGRAGGRWPRDRLGRRRRSARRPVRRLPGGEQVGRADGVEQGDGRGGRTR